MRLKGLSDKQIKRIAQAYGRISFDRYFWIVVDPHSVDSELEDIVWKTDLDGFAKYCMGGSTLPSQETMIIYENEEDAMRDAEERLEISKDKSYLLE